MNREEFLYILEKTLRNKKVEDIEDIVCEYNDHFTFKINDGYSEEEVAHKLGDPEKLALQFASDSVIKKTSFSKKLFVTVGLFFLDIFAVITIVILFYWLIIMGIIAMSFLGVSVFLFGKMNIFNLIPPMPYQSAFIFGLAFIALSLLTSVGTVYCAKYVRQLARAYSRFHSNCLAGINNKAIYPKLALHPQINPKLNRKMRNLALIAVSSFAIIFIIGYIVSAISAGALGFWHEWNWFV